VFYTIYKTTNLINGKIYIGKHKAENINDDYLGSGKHLGHAIEKYGIENFKKEIIFVFDNEAEMNAKEAELVTEEFVKEDTNYNLCPGGKGGWGYINSNSLNTYEGKPELDKWKLVNLAGPALHNKLKKDPDFKLKYNSSISNSLKNYYEENDSHWIGKKHTEETKQKIGKKTSISQKGERNSQHGSVWITNGKENKKISKTDILPVGWTKGRKMK
jgi:hypothetical protein